ncbi:hypothetical protein KIPB_009604, partial [Kipferlia bialata]
RYVALSISLSPPPPPLTHAAVPNGPCDSPLRLDIHREMLASLNADIRRRYLNQIMASEARYVRGIRTNTGSGTSPSAEKAQGMCMVVAGLIFLGFAVYALADEDTYGLVLMGLIGLLILWGGVYQVKEGTANTEWSDLIPTLVDPRTLFGILDRAAIKASKECRRNGQPVRVVVGGTRGMLTDNGDFTAWLEVLVEGHGPAETGEAGGAGVQPMASTGSAMPYPTPSAPYVPSGYQAAAPVASAPSLSPSAYQTKTTAVSAQAPSAPSVPSQGGNTVAAGVQPIMGFQPAQVGPQAPAMSYQYQAYDVSAPINAPDMQGYTPYV